MYNDVMKRTTIMAEDELLDRLRAIARREHVSLAQVIREALELRASQPARRLNLIGAGESTGEPRDMGRQSGEMTFEPRSWR
jgi:predicted transcriptional regulator